MPSFEYSWVLSYQHTLFPLLSLFPLPSWTIPLFFHLICSIPPVNSRLSKFCVYFFPTVLLLHFLSFLHTKSFFFPICCSCPGSIFSYFSLLPPFSIPLPFLPHCSSSIYCQSLFFFPTEHGKGGLLWWLCSLAQTPEGPVKTRIYVTALQTQWPTVPAQGICSPFP